MNKILALLTSLFVITALTACGTIHDRFSTPNPQEKSMEDASQLSAYHWTLSTITPKGQTAIPAPAALNGAPLVLDFANQQVSINGLCNLISSRYRVEGNRITIDQMISTLKACSDINLMRYEQDISQYLPTVTHWHVEANAEAPGLVLTFSDGTLWHMQGTPTADTLYGGQPERVFLEVAAQKVACSHPLIPDYQCLNVREITYDNQGIKTHTGDWQHYYGTIQGYEHQPGIRNVLRLKRYTLKNPPADAPNTVDVLDMIVESDSSSE